MSEINFLKRKLARERQARKQAEQILETKAIELFRANEALQKLNENLETQIQQRTQDLRESEEKYRNVIDQATDIIYSTDEEGYFTFVNPIGSDAFGFSQDEIIGKRYIDFVPEDYKAGLFQYYTRVKEGGVENDYYEFPIKSKSGTLHWIGQNVNRIVRPNGEVYFNAVARDITLRKKTERELEEVRQALIQSEVKYRSVLENMDLGLMEVNTQGEIIRVYDKFCIMTGYSSEELVGKDAIDILIVEEFKDVLRKQDENRLKGKSEVYEVQLKRKDGKHIWVLISGAPFYNANGDVIGSLGIHYDITERKQLEQNLEIQRQKAVKAQQAEQQFLANMSHEIRTPLNAIVGMSHLLKDSELDGKQNEYVEILSDSANLLKGLVSDILDISKIDSGMAEVNESVFDLNKLLRTLLKTFTHRAKEKGLLLNFTLDGLENAIVKSDRQWINQILINLLNNAVKFTHKGEVHLLVRKEEFENNKNIFYFEVSDTGIGISEDEAENIFSSFKQANTRVRKDYGGTGLGLSISSRLVSLLGGELELKSKENIGSRFFFSLNLKDASDDVLQPTSIVDYNMDAGRKMKVLVVEDNLMNQKYILTLLNKWNIQFDIADNGLIAVEKFKLNYYDMIFMDLSMPVMDGYEATGIIRSMDTRDVPIIALTASTFLSKKELALKSGMSDFLAKPFTPDDLSLIIRKHLLHIANNGSNGKSIVESIDVGKLDDSELEVMYGSDHAHALDMFETYRSIIEEELNVLVSFVAHSNLDQSKKQAHKIKPMFSMVGLNTLSITCQDIERYAEANNVEKVKVLCDGLRKSVLESLRLIDDEIIKLTDIVKDI